MGHQNSIVLITLFFLSAAVNFGTEVKAGSHACNCLRLERLKSCF